MAATGVQLRRRWEINPFLKKTESIADHPCAVASEETMLHCTNILRSGLAWHGITAIVGRLLALITTAFSGLVLARSLGPEDFAHFSVILSLVSIFSIVAAFGLWNVAPVVMAQAKLRGNRHKNRGVKVIVGTLIVTSLTGSLGAFGVLIGGNQFLFEQSIPVVFSLAIALCVLGRALMMVFAEISRARDQVVVANLFAGIGGGGLPNGILLGGLALLSCLTTLNWKLSLIALLFSCIASFPMYLLLIWIEVEPTSISNATQLVESDSNLPPSVQELRRKVIVSGFFFTLFGLLVATTDQADIIIAALLSSPLETSNYVAARRGSSLVLTLTACAHMTSGVFLTRLYQSHQIAQLNEVMRSLSAIVSIVGLLICTFIFVWPEAYLQLLFGKEYQGGGQLLVVLTISQLIICFTGNGGFALMMTGHERVVLIVQAFAVLLLMTVGGYSAWKYGLFGFTVAVSSVQALQSILNCILSYTTTGINTFPDYRRLLTLKNVFANASNGK